MDLDDVVRRINELSGSLVDTAEGRLPLIELTGGEPLLQKGSIPLMESLSKAGFTVLLETSGAHDIEEFLLRLEESWISSAQAVARLTRIGLKSFAPATD